MLLEKVLLNEFANFVRSTYGVKVTMWEEKRGDEYGRVMVAGRFYVIRDHNDTTEQALTIEVNCSDKQHEQVVEAQAEVVAIDNVDAGDVPVFAGGLDHAVEVLAVLPGADDPLARRGGGRHGARGPPECSGGARGRASGGAQPSHEMSA